jgi:hypothetical protein
VTPCGSAENVGPFLVGRFQEYRDTEDNFMKATVHTSATVRDITAMAKRVLKDTPTSDYNSVADSRMFLMKLGKEAAKKIDWQHLQALAPN